jgi:hypothetical protein
VVVRIGGSYVLRARAPIAVDGHSLRPGQSASLAVGRHVFTAPAPSELRLDVPPPPRQNAPGRLFHGF